MKRISAGGAGALAFLILLVVAMVIANPPGGKYTPTDVTKYVQSGHRPAVIIGLYLMGLACVGLLFLLRRLRDSIAGPRATVFWGLAVAGAVGILAGFALVASVPIAMGVGGSAVTVAPTVTFTIVEMGWSVLGGAGFLLVGLALLTFALGPTTLPAWVRWLTLVGGLAFAAGLAWFPLPIAGLWLLVIGIWLLMSERGTAPETAAVSAT